MNPLHKVKQLPQSTKIALSIIGVAFFIRVILALLYTPSGDGCWHASVARFIGETCTVPDFENLGRGGFARSPLYHMIAGLFYAVFTALPFVSGEVGIRLVNPLIGALIMWVSYLLFKQWTSVRVALWALVFLAFTPIFIYYSYLTYLDVPIVLFILLAVYFLEQKKYVATGIATGLALLTNINALPGLALIGIIIFVKEKKNFLSCIKPSLIVYGIAGLFILPWYVRNWILFKNPVWPWLNSLIGGVQVTNDALPADRFGLDSLLNVQQSATEMYAGFFGIPNGNIKTLFFFDIPYFELLIGLWVIGTVLFVLPFWYTKKSNEKTTKHVSWVLWSWMGIYFVYMLITSTLLSGTTYIRYALPALIPLALWWGMGMTTVIDRVKPKKAWYVLGIVLTVGVLCGFVFVEFAKTGLATREWNKYTEDFEWIQQNTPKTALIMGQSQCHSYHFHRQTISPPRGTALSVLEQKPFTYIWVSEDFSLDPSTYTDQELETFKKFPLVYTNSKTGTHIYQVPP